MQRFGETSSTPAVQKTITLGCRNTWFPYGAHFCDPTDARTHDPSFRPTFNNSEMRSLLVHRIRYVMDGNYKEPLARLEVWLKPFCTMEALGSRNLTQNTLPVTMPMVSIADSFESVSKALRGFAAKQTRVSLGMYFVLASLLCHLLWKLYVRRRDNPRGLPYPPGPKPLPLIGNLFDFARENESAAYLGMAHKYGQTQLVLRV